MTQKFYDIEEEQQKVNEIVAARAETEKQGGSGGRKAKRASVGMLIVLMITGVGAISLSRVEILPAVGLEQASAQPEVGVRSVGIAEDPTDTNKDSMPISGIRVVSEGMPIGNKGHNPMMPYEDFQMIEDKGLTKIILSNGMITPGVVSSGMAQPVDISLTVDTSIQRANEAYGQLVDVSVFTANWKNTIGNINYQSIASTIYSGADFGRLTIPALGMKDKIVRYGGQPQIDIGLCQYFSWDLPGTQGVSMLAAHNYNPDWKIGQLAVGDKLYYSTIYGNFEYQVYSATINREGRDVWWLRDSYYAADPTDLVLMTCYPFDSDGSDGIRYLVFCKEISGPHVTHGPVTDKETYLNFDAYRERVS